jgi:hypothetical protein
MISCARILAAFVDVLRKRSERVDKIGKFVVLYRPQLLLKRVR